MIVSCLIPFRDADGTRTRAHHWMLARWRYFWPDWEYIVASDDGVDPFNKSMAVNKAAKQATSDVLAILDADTWIEPQYVEQSLEAIERGVPWVVPARRSLRLKQEISEYILDTDPTAPTYPRIRTSAIEQAGAVVGFLWFVPREGFAKLGGMDERIRGWGGEDTVFTRAADVMLGNHLRLAGTVVSLWHARPRDVDRKRIWLGQGRRRDDVDKEALVARYRSAHSPAAMAEVLAR